MSFSYFISSDTIGHQDPELGIKAIGNAALVAWHFVGSNVEVIQV